MADSQTGSRISRRVMDCGGKRSATPLWRFGNGERRTERAPTAPVTGPSEHAGGGEAQRQDPKAHGGVAVTKVLCPFAAGVVGKASVGRAEEGASRRQEVFFRGRIPDRM